MQERHKTSVRRWLWIVYGMIFCMVIIGGVTRLTGSGLSMVEWRPLMGALPPIGEEEWGRVFKLYQRSPQYQEVNQWMSIDDFKQIFFWEYIHRLFGRLIGLVFFFPWLYFTLRGQLRGSWRTRALIALFLGGAQGLLGWYMVKSGLVDRPEVSHFRLAAHLCLAFLCGMWVWSMILALASHPSRASQTDQSNSPPSSPPSSSPPLSPLLTRLIWGFLPLLTLQIIYGAFMAGTRAGYLYKTFPTMNGSWIAPQWGAMSPWWRDLTSNPDSVHFIHRTLAWLILGWGLVLVWCVLRSHPHILKSLRRPVVWLGGLLSLQFILGVLTVVSGMNHGVAVAHQGGSFLLLTAAVTLIQRAYPLTDPFTDPLADPLSQSSTSNPS